MNGNDDERRKWEHKMLKVMMAGAFAMMAMCAALVWHIIKG